MAVSQLIDKNPVSGANRQNNGTSDQAYNNGYSEHPFPIFSGCINVIFPQLLTDNNGSSVGKTPTGDSTNVYHHNSDGICSNHIITNMPKNCCECGTGKARTRSFITAGLQFS